MFGVSGVLRWSVLFALVMAATSLAAAGTAPTQFEQEKTDRVAPPFAAPWTADPLAAVDPRLWIDTLFETHSLSETVEVAKQASQTSYELLPLGDADHDGAADYIVEITEHAPQAKEGDEPMPDVETLVAHSGRTGAILWTFQVPKESYWYLEDDVNGDSVRELMVVSGTGESDGIGDGTLAASAYHATMVEKLRHEVVSGATGKSLFAIPTEMHGEFTYASAGYLARGYAFLDSFEFGAVGRFAEGTWMGVDLVKVRYDYDSVNAFALLVFGGLSYGREALTLEHFDAGGHRAWSATFDDGTSEAYLSDVADYTGDGVPDYVVNTYGSWAGAHVCPVVTCVAEYGSTSTTMRIALIDGTNGQEKWKFESDPYLGEAGSMGGGNLRGGKGTILFGYLGRDAGDNFQSFGTRITQLDAASGTVVDDRRWPNEFVFGTRFGDVDGDGSDDLVMIRAAYEMGLTEPTWPEKADLYAARADYTPIWSLKGKDMDDVEMLFYGDPAKHPDFNGDAVPEFTIAKRKDPADYMSPILVQVFNGRDAQPLWTFERDFRVSSLLAVEDANGDKGQDVVVTTFDRPEAPKDSKERSEFNKKFNLTDWPGFTELHRGGDLGLVWKKQIHQPAADVKAKTVVVGVASAGDVNANKYGDLLLTLKTPRCVFMKGETQQQGNVIMISGFIECDPAKTKQSYLNFGLVIEGSDGSTLASYPAELPKTLPVDGVSVTLGEAAPIPATPLEAQDAKGILPGLDLVAALAVLGLAGSVWRRRV